MTLVWTYLPLLLLTILIEGTLVALLCSGRWRGHRRSALVTSIALNLFTHPIATMLAWSGRGTFLQLEFLVIFVEALGYIAIVRLTPQRALFVSFVANVVTMLAGIAHSIFVTAA